MYEADETVRDLIDKAKRLEGLPRHASVHASGVLISQKDVGEYVPVAVEQIMLRLRSLKVLLWNIWDC